MHYMIKRSPVNAAHAAHWRNKCGENANKYKMTVNSHFAPVCSNYVGVNKPSAEHT